jgi:hypothetical protein
LEDRVTPAAISIGDAVAIEGNTLTFTVTSDVPASPGDITFDFATADGTATAGTDYVALVGTGTITAGNTSTTISVTVNGDTTVELDETFTVTLSNPSINDTIADGTATGTILNDDSATVTIAPAAAVEGAGVVFTATLSNAVDTAVTVTLTPSKQAGDTATETTDFATAPQVITIPAGSLNASATVGTVADAVVEPNETFTATLGGLNANGRAVTIAKGTVIGTIVNDDATALTVQDVVQAEDGGPVTFTVTLSNPVQGGFTVDYQTTSGTAAAGSDFVGTSGTLTFAGTAGETKTFAVTIIADNTVELDEAFTVSLFNVVPAAGTDPAGIDTTDTATGTITNDDGAEFKITRTASAVEGGPVTFTVTLSNPVDADTSVTVTTADGTAVAGNDYTALAGQVVSFPAGTTSKTVTVLTAADAAVEADETFTVTLGGLVDGGQPVFISATDNVGTGTILDDDATTLTIQDVTQAEAGGPMTFTVTLSNPVQGGFTVDYKTADGTALVADGDYTATTGTLTFAGTAGEAKTFQVVVLNENLVEPNDEFFTVSLANVVLLGSFRSPTQIDATDTAKGVITNDDTATITLAGATSAEGTNLIYTVTLSNPVSKDVSVDFSTLAGVGVRPATAGADFTVTASKLTFAAKAQVVTVAVPIIDDRRVEGAEQFDAKVANKATDAGVDAFVTVAKAQDTATITDNDTAVFSFTQAANSRLEDDVTGVTATVQLTVTAVGAGPDGLDQPITVRVSSGGTATNGVDYKFTNPTDLTFPAGNFTTTTKDIAFDLVEDFSKEGDETIVFALAVQADATGTQAVVGNPATHTFTITGDDEVVDPGKLFAASTGAGALPLVRLFTNDGKFSRQFQPFESTFRGGVRVATGDFNGDGFDDVAAGAGPGGGPRVVVIDGKTGGVLASFFAYEQTFTNGVFVAVGDVTGDGRADVVVGAGSLGGPRVQVRDGATFEVVQDFFAYDPGFRGGVRVAVGDVDGDQEAGDDTAEIVTGPGISGGPNVIVYDIDADNTLSKQASFFALDSTYRGGVFVGVAPKFGGGGVIVVGPESTADPRGTLLETFFPSLPNTDGLQAGRRAILDELDRPSEVRTFFVTDAGVTAGPAASGFDPSFRGGVRVAGGDPVNGEPTIVIGPGTRSDGLIKRLRLTEGDTLETLDTILPFGDIGTSSIYVG